MFTLVTSEHIAGSASHTPIQRCQWVIQRRNKVLDLSSDQRCHSRIQIAAACQTQRYRYPGRCNVTDRYRYRCNVVQCEEADTQTQCTVLLRRLSESNSKIPEERATKVSAKIEKELFSFYRDTDSKYKNKYRSLMFNLKDPKNNVLYKRVLKGDITPEHLIKMTPEELASRELAAWRQRENRHTIEMIEKEQREVERRPITKITHKGEIEIESDAPMKEPEAMETEESVDSLIEAVNQTLGVEDVATLPSGHMVSFKKFKQPHKVFSTHPEFEDLVQRHMERPDKRFLGQKALGARYVYAGESRTWI
ncbi:unnamed protein product [Ranitomeya imitator]|uniref:TFIIS central domain-containing protein n=1 Tax=Ranitomeya imitator TaxID=111125 RepID=A0ABN9LTS4_9NEOB|nr:unnamed protein product [Ranitomeya imitator]